MNKDVIKSNFVKPYFIKELGCEGLWSGDIGNSLEVKSTHIREKLSKRGFLDRLKQRGCIIAIAMKNNNNGLEYTDYALDIKSAKIFVAKYDNDIGFAYLDYLLECEKAVDKMSNMEPEELLLMQCQMLVDQKRKMREVESKVNTIQQRQDVLELEQNTIKKRQEAVRDAWLDFPVPGKKLPDKTLRKRFNEVIRSYCKVHGFEDGYSLVYKKVYADFRDRFDVDLQARARNESVRTCKKVSPLDYAEREGWMEDLYNVAYNYCSPDHSEEKGDNLYLFESYRD